MTAASIPNPLRVLNVNDDASALYVATKVLRRGIGLSRDDLDRIFDLFFQVDNSIARSLSGLGIGLTMARRLIEMHDGTISAASDGRGTGSTFSIERPELPAIAAAAPNETHSLAGARVLLVDDNVDTCELMQMSLEDAGCVVQVANDGGEALRRASEARFDVAVLDIGLPVLDGYQVAGSIAESQGALRPKLIALTGYGRAEDRGRALRVGFDAHMVKPTDLDMLKQTIGDLLKNARVRVG